MSEDKYSCWSDDCDETFDNAIDKAWHEAECEHVPDEVRRVRKSGYF